MQQGTNSGKDPNENIIPTEGVNDITGQSHPILEQGNYIPDIYKEYGQNREEVLRSIESFYKQGKVAYEDGKLKDAEMLLAKAMKPMLSRPSAQHTLVSVKDLPEVMLDAMYHLGKIYLTSTKYFNNYSKTAAILQYCAKFAEKYGGKLEGKSPEAFQREAYEIEEKFIDSINSTGKNLGVKNLGTKKIEEQIIGYKKELEVIRQQVKNDLDKIKDLDVKQINERAEKVAKIYQKCTEFFINPNENNVKEHKTNNDSSSTNARDNIGSDNNPGKWWVLNLVLDICKKSGALFGFASRGSANNTEYTNRGDVDTNKNNEDNDNDNLVAETITKKGLLQKMLSDCMEQLGPAPQGCEYSIIGLGSLAAGKMTPWSDIEFAVLINEEKEEYKEYFRNLTKLLHIKVVNLGETPLRSNGIEVLNNYRSGDEAEDWFWDEVLTSGFSFDGPDWHACKLPLGRQGNYQVKDESGKLITKKNFELILTPKQLAEFQVGNTMESSRSHESNTQNTDSNSGKDEDIDDGGQTNSNQNSDNSNSNQTTKQDDSWFASDKHLVQALRSVSLIDGSQKLLDSYRKEIDNPDYRELQQARALQILKEDTEKFHLKLGDEEEGKLFDVKKDIYRVGDRIIDALAWYYGIVPEEGQTAMSSWQLLDKMQTGGILSKEGTQHLKEALGIATELRLNTYIHNQSQGESFSFYHPAVDHLSEQEKQKYLEQTFYFTNTEILHHFYYVVLQLQSSVSVFWDEKYHSIANLILSKKDLYDGSNRTKGLVHARFLEYDQALKYLKVAMQEGLDGLKILIDLTFLCSKIGQIEDHVMVTEQYLEIQKKKHPDKQDHPTIAASYNNLGIAYKAKGEYDAAIEQHKQALAIKKKAYVNPNHPALADSYNNLGIAYRTKGEYDAAIEQYKQALAIKKKAYVSSPNQPALANSYNNLGAAYYAKGEHDAAIEQYKQALEIQKKAYLSSPNHPDLAASYNNLGSAYAGKGEHDAAIKHYKQALDIMKKAYASSPNHPALAASYNNLGNAYKTKGAYDAAIEHHKQALEIQKKTYASSLNHADIAMSYNNLGTVYYAKSEYDVAIELYKQAFAIRKQAYVSSPNHPDLADSYNDLGTTYCAKGEYDAAIEQHKQALAIWKKAYVSSPNHPDIAASYNNLGNAHYAKGEYDVAIEHHKQALEIYKKAYATSPNHPALAASYNNLGIAYAAKGEYDVAIEQYKQALEIQEKAHASSLNHPALAASYNNLGTAYYAKGECDAAIERYKQALDIYKKAYASSPNHPEIAASYSGLGITYAAKGEHDAAIEHHQQALEIMKKVYVSSPNHADIAMSYNNLGLAYEAKGEYDVAIEQHKQSLEIQKKAYASSPNHPDIARSLMNLGITYYIAGQFEEADQYLGQFDDIAKKIGDKRFIDASTLLYTANLLQLGSVAFLAGDSDGAGKYYGKISADFTSSGFKSQGFIALHLNAVSTAYDFKALKAMINCQLVLLKVDPELKHGNHYHNLACFYACLGKIKEANAAFIQALEAKKETTAGLYVEYAQFLLLNRGNKDLNVEDKQVAEYLHVALTTERVGGLSYGKLEQNTVDPYLKKLVQQKHTSIVVNPKMLAYYLLLKYSQYTRGADGVDDNSKFGSSNSLLEKMQEYCQQLLDEISLRMLADACSIAGMGDLAAKYQQQAEVIEAVELVLAGKRKIGASFNGKLFMIDPEQATGYTAKLERLQQDAMKQKDIDSLMNYAKKLYGIYNLVLPQATDKFELAAGKLAALYLTTDDIESYIQLKFAHENLTLDFQLLENLDVDKQTALLLEEQVNQQLLAALQEESDSKLEHDVNENPQPRVEEVYSLGNPKDEEE